MQSRAPLERRGRVSRTAKDDAFDALQHLPAWLPVAERLIWLLVADRTNDHKGYAWCSSADLAARSGLTPGAVRHRIGNLEMMDLLDVERRSGRTNRYRIVIPNPRQEARPTRAVGREPAPWGATPAPPGARNQLENQLENLAPNGADVSREQCGHRWRSVSGECPTCLADEQAAS